MHDANCFVTLTYDDSQLPDDLSVSHRAVQLFMKRLRKSVGKVRFFACGEYGERLQRPHYHVIIFGHDFPDRTPWRQTPTGYVVYRSTALEKLWPFGFCEIGTVTHQSAGYVARYVVKKVTGEKAADHYSRVHPETGELLSLRPEFICMSNRPGIGGSWYDQFSGDAFPSDFLIIEGSRVPVPRYYKKKLDERSALATTAARKQKAFRHADNNTPERLATRQELQLLRVQRLHREMETEQ